MDSMDNLHHRQELSWLQLQTKSQRTRQRQRQRRRRTRKQSVSPILTKAQAALLLLLTIVACKRSASSVCAFQVQVGGFKPSFTTGPSSSASSSTTTTFKINNFNGINHGDMNDGQLQRHSQQPQQYRHHRDGRTSLQLYSRRRARSLAAISDPRQLADPVLLEVDAFVDLDLQDDEAVEEADMRYAATMQMTEMEAQFFNGLESFLQMVPIFIPVLAYLTYDPLAKEFAHVIELIANRNWVAVDGGAYQAKIIAPAINGVVVPSISILFATLTGTTVSTLRDRQAKISNSLNMEAGQLRMLQSLLDSVPRPICDTTKCRRYMMQYVSRLIAESQPTVVVPELRGSIDSELNGVLKELNQLAFNERIPDTIIGQCYSVCSKLFEERAKRISALRSGFPPLHYAIVIGLALSICLAFLLETDQQLLVFLNAIQLRILWTMLAGTFSALAIVAYDLIEPFRGSYQVSQCVDQLYTLRLTLDAQIEDDVRNRRTGVK